VPTAVQGGEDPWLGRVKVFDCVNSGRPQRGWISYRCLAIVSTELHVYISRELTLDPLGPRKELPLFAEPG
jgi:hypothetical protein